MLNRSFALMCILIGIVFQVSDAAYGPLVFDCGGYGYLPPSRNRQHKL